MAPTPEQIADITRKNSEAIVALKKGYDALSEQNKTLTERNAQLESHLKRMPAPNTPHPNQIFGLPNAIIGEMPNTSRGFSFMKMLGVMRGFIKPENAKVECDMSQRMSESLVGRDRYEWCGAGQPNAPGGMFLAPLSSSYLHQDDISPTFRKEMRDSVMAGVLGADPQEMGWIRTKNLQAKGYSQKALSWLNEFNGGSLVAPPEMGELIELLRNKEALVNAGARTVPLPPQGRIKYPRQTAPSNTYWVGENAQIAESDIGTGELTLQAKKLAVLIKAPNELIRFASPAAEALMRDDMTKSLALGLDLAGLEGLGGDTRPLGVINTNGVTQINSSQQGSNGDLIVGNDIYRFIAAVEEANSEFEAFIMRPKTLYKYYQLRADAVGQGDAQGPFLFNLIREAGDGVMPTLAGYPVIKSTQISQVRSKGSSSNLTYIVGGMWSDMLIGMFGAIEFSATTLGDTPFTRDQTWVRGILSADVGLRHPISFVWMDNLGTTLTAAQL